MKKLFTLILLIVALRANSQSGITWTGMAMNVAANTYGNMHPRMVMDAQGNPLVIWGKMSDKSAYFSRWNGTAFTTPVKLNPAWLSVATASWMGPDIASKGDTVYVVVKRTPEASDTNFNYIMRSFDGGQNFTSPVRIDNINDSMSRFPTITTDGAGQPIVAFMKFDNAFMDSRWVVTRSNDFGMSFTPDVKATGWGASAEVCDCCPGAVVASGSKVALLYRDNNVNIRDNWMGISTNGGNSFSNGYNVDNHNWMVMACPATGPDGVIIGDTMYSVFMNGAPTARNYFSKASLSAAATTNVNGIAATTPGLQSQNYPRIANYGNAAAITWVQSVSGTIQLPLLFTNNILSGFPTVYDTVDLGDVTNADVALSNGKIFVVWEDDVSGTVKYRSGTYNTTTGINETLSEEEFSISPNPGNGLIHVTLPAGEYTLRVNNYIGQTIETHSLKDIQSGLNINSANWAKGIYFFNVDQGNHVVTRKFVKQ